MGVDPYQGGSASASAAGSTSAASSSGSASQHVAKPRGQKRKIRTSFGIQANGQDDHALETEQLPVKLKKHKATRDEANFIAPVSAEKRLRKFRPKAPSNFAAIYGRATTQRFFVLSRTLCDLDYDDPAMFLEISGSTGNVYRVCIGRQPTCDCPHALAGNQCKHTIFVLSKVLRAKYEYVYQLALLSSELQEIFAAAPDPAKEKACEEIDKNRKAVEGDCPICFEEMVAGPGKEALVWCKAACGQNIHKQCLHMWATTKRRDGGSGASTVTCPYCRSEWEVDEDAGNVADINKGVVLEDGYVNVADQLGISTQRDYSTYNRYWGGNPGSYYGRPYRY